jgi:integrase
MANNKLTAAAVNAARFEGTSRKLFDGNGLFLHVTPSGRYWRLKFRWGGRERLISLGVYPETSLAQARQRRDEARRQLDAGIDPAAQRRAEKAARASAASFEAVAREWYQEKHAYEVVESHARRNLRRLEQYAFPAFGARPIAELEPPEVLDALRRIERKGYVESAHRVKTLVSQVMRYAVATGRARRDVTADLSDALRSAKPQHHRAIVDPDELAGLLRAVDAYAGAPTTAAALCLASLAPVRPGELRAARWADIDLEAAQWTLTAKGGHSLIVPLSRQAVAVLAEQRERTGRNAYVFPSARTRSRPVSNATVNAALARLDFGDRMTGHGWRATFRTLAVERLGFGVEIVEMQLGHRVRDVHGVAYNRTTWLAERRDLMQRWADYLDMLRGAGGTDE